MRIFDGDTIAPALAAILEEAIRRRKRIEALEAALREIAGEEHQGVRASHLGDIARRALEEGNGKQ